RAP
ncbi:hypothetical protein MK372_02725, partial [Streptococcus oralis]